MNPSDYEFRTKPFDHQREVFMDTATRPAYGLFWEQGTGKTKAIIDTAAFLYDHGEIDTILVIAPNGVHRNWITDEIPVHMPKRLARKIQMMYWQSRRAKTMAHSREVGSLIGHAGLRILTMNYEAILTDLGIKAIGALMKDHNVLLVFDESHYIKTPGAKRTKRSIALAKRAKYVRILTGTPIANSPFDAYSQLRALDPEFWKQHGFTVFSTFKAHFGIFRKGINNQQGGRQFEQCVGYRRLDQLKAMIGLMTHRVTKDQVLDLPPKLYQRRFFDLTPAQQKVYNEIKNDAISLLDSGDTVTTPLAITRLLRLQQITCGYVPTDEGNEFETFDDKNPRLDLVEDICDNLGHSAIIWARFTRDIDLMMERLGDRAVRYDGQVNDDGREMSKQAFQNGDVQFFVGNPAAGAEGLTLTAAKTVIYASNSFKLLDRLQSEDRAHRIGQDGGLDNNVAYIDIIAPGTVDEYIVAALRNKENIASELTGDKLREWI
ncbi:MAG: DEAD/DEAH box helicase [bacterium]|nr:DEAD/DEAH box helicase [bacterium]